MRRNRFFMMLAIENFDPRHGATRQGRKAVLEEMSGGGGSLLG
jgi:hypothetical protein